MDQQTLAKLEETAQLLYSGANNADPRVQALLEEYKGIGCVPKCTFVLTTSPSLYGQLFAATSLLNLVTKQYTSLDMPQRIDLRNFILGVLWNNASMPNVVATTLMQTLGRLTKLGWFDSTGEDFPFRDTPTQLNKFLQGTMDQCIVGLQAQATIISTVNEQGNIRSFTLQRKIASSFRDVSLLSMFELAMEMMARCERKEIVPTGQGERLVSAVLQLAIGCLTFDFIGTTPDEAIDDSAAAEVPSSWRPTIMAPTTLTMLFNLYAALQPPLKSKVMEVIVQMGSVRRSLFVKDERQDYLTRLANHIFTVIQTREGLSDQASYHEVCRLLSRFKLHEAISVLDDELVQKMIEMVAEFTLSSIQSWQYVQDSLGYLIDLWAKLVAYSARRPKTPSLAQIEQYSPRIAHDYIQVRLNAVEMVMQMNLEDPLDNRDDLIMQLDKLAVIARFQYEEVWREICSALDSITQSYQDQLTAVSPNQNTLSVLDRQLAWLVYMAAAVIGGRTTTMQTGSAEALDGDMACKVLTLLPVLESRRDRCSMVVEYSLIAFFKGFSRVYIGSHVQASSKAFSLLGERLGLPDQLMLLDVFVQKIVTILKVWPDTPEVVEAALSVLSDWAAGYGTVRLLLKLGTVQYMLKNNTAATFPFLSMPSFLKARTVFYGCLSQILFVTLEGDGDDIDDFMSPFLGLCEQLKSLFDVETESQLRANQDAKYAAMCLARDLRGIVSATHNKTQYVLLFDYLYPAATKLLQRAIVVWHDDAQLTQSVLRFLQEFATNQNKRIDFDVSSANGTFLFKQVSEILSEFSTRLAATSAEGTEAKARASKGFTMCLKILHAAFSGKYTNFGVFRLYQDDTLDKAYGVILVIIQSVPLQELLTYPKMARAYYTLLETLCSGHIEFLCSLELPAFQYLMASLYEGIGLKDQHSVAQAALVLDTILSQHLSGLLKPNRRGFNYAKLAYLLDQCKDLQPRMLQMMLTAIVFEDCQNYWSLSRPLLCLILLNEKYFMEISAEFLRSQAQERQPELRKCFANLMRGIEHSLSQRNRDLFTKNINSFRREISTHIKTPTPDTAAAELDLMTG